MGIQKPQSGLLMVTVLFVGGILSCYQMSKLEDPEIKVKLAMVVTTYPGHPPTR